MSDRQFLVSLAKPIPGDTGVVIGGKERRFGKSGHSFILKDAGEAREMNEELGRKGAGHIVVSEIPAAKGSKSIKYIQPKMTAEERRKAMIKDGWTEVRTGKWRKAL